MNEIPDNHNDVSSRQARPQSKLDRLPPDVKSELDACILRDWGAKKIKPYLMALYPEKAETLDCAYSTYQGYINAHKYDLQASRRIEEELQSSSTDLTDLKTLIAGGAKPDQIKQALQGLFDQCEARLRLIEQQRRTNPNDPRWESHYANYQKEKRVILETLVALNEDNRLTDDVALNKELEKFAYALLDWVLSAHRRTYGDNSKKFEENLKSAVKEGMQTWLSSQSG